MTYRNLLSTLSSLTEEQLDCTVTIHDSHLDEYYPAGYAIADTDVLDKNHPILNLRS